MDKVMPLLQFGLVLILVYILVSNFAGTVAIGKVATTGLPPVIQSLQGVGKGYPAPAR